MSSTNPNHNDNNKAGDFSGGSVVKNPPANVTDMGSIPGPGGFHMQLSPWATTIEPVLESPGPAATEA